MTTDIQAALARLREALQVERRYGPTYPVYEHKVTDDALAELERLLAPPPAEEPWTRRGEVLTLGALERLLLRAELGHGPQAGVGALLETLQGELL